MPWAFPAWVSHVLNDYIIIMSLRCQVGNDTNSPYKYPEITAGYIVKWIQGAKKTYQLDIDYVGVSGCG